MQAATHHECPRTKFANPALNLGPVSAISNRYNKLLEFHVSYTKHTVMLTSNRYKMPLVAQRVWHQISRNAPLAVSVKMRGDWRPGARAVTIQTQMSLEIAI